MFDKTPQDPAKKFMVPNFDFCSNHLTLDIRSVILLGHSMTNGNPFALIFFVPDAQNAICPWSFRPLDLFVQGPFALIFYVWTIYYGLSLALMSRIMHFLYIGSQICKILKIRKVHWSKLHLLIYPYLRSKQLHLSIIIIAIFKMYHYCFQRGNN